MTLFHTGTLVPVTFKMYAIAITGVLSLGSARIIAAGAQTHRAYI
jgi:hypothetical protein